MLAMFSALGSPLGGAIHGLRGANLSSSRGRARVAPSPSAVLSQERLHGNEAEARRLEYTDAFSELKELAQQKQSVNRAQEVSDRMPRILWLFITVWANTASLAAGHPSLDGGAAHVQSGKLLASAVFCQIWFCRKWAR